jgi:hypothetical protein
MRRSLLVVLAVSLAPATASAGDSTWLLCKGVVTAGGGDKQYVAASLLEHRAADGSHRDLDITFMKGAHVFTATLRGKAGDFEAGKVKLKIKQKKRAIFDGTAQLTMASGATTFDLDGKLDTAWGQGKATNDAITGSLTCDELDDLAIGH